jgi:hypothetical protein
MIRYSELYRVEKEAAVVNSNVMFHHSHGWEKGKHKKTQKILSTIQN